VILDPTKIARYVNKANIVTAAWRALFGAVPTKHSVILAMAVAEFETHLGDAGAHASGGGDTLLAQHRADRRRRRRRERAGRGDPHVGR
jgi:hypothetical protein